MADHRIALGKYVTELIGTFVFTFSVIGILIAGADTTSTAIGIGVALMVMVYASGAISGGHLNPSVSIAAYLRGALPLADLGPYIVAQLTGAAAAFGVGFGLWSHRYHYGGPVDIGDNVWRAFLAELVFTFALCYIVLQTATSKKNAGNSFYGAAIGLVVTVGVVAVGGISGASFNPAITLGLLLPGLFAWKFAWVYAVSEVLGGVLAAYAYKATALDGRRSRVRT